MTKSLRTVMPALIIAGLAVGMTSILVADNPVSKNADEDARPEVVEKSMHEFMEYVYQPTYKRLKASMQKEPADRNGWKAIKADSLLFAECANLLLIRTPEKNSAHWNQSSAATRKFGAELYRAAGKKDFESATKAYHAMLTNCNACHKEFADGKYQLKP